jgi:hypothetical protein
VVGKYEVVGDGTVASGVAYARFSDGSEGEIVIEATGERIGRFVVKGSLVGSTWQSLD